MDRVYSWACDSDSGTARPADRKPVVADDGETTDDLVGDMIEVLTSFCARLYGRRGARNRALRALTAAPQGA